MAACSLIRIPVSRFDKSWARWRQPAFSGLMQLERLEQKRACDDLIFACPFCLGRWKSSFPAPLLRREKLSKDCDNRLTGAGNPL